MEPSLPPTDTRSPLAREVSAVSRLAAPVVLGHLGMMLLGVVDTMMLGRVSEQALAAGALGHSVSVGLIMFPFGVLLALDPLVGQAHGAGDRERLSSRMRQGLILAALLSVPLSLAMWPLEGPLRLAGQRPEIATPSAAYLRALIPGNLAYLLFVSVRQSLQAMSVVRPAVIAIVAANLANVVANYALIFGNFGFPALGVVGSGYATSISRWVLLVTLFVASRRRLAGYLEGFTLRPDPAVLGKILRLGLPIGVQISLEIWMFVIVAIMMGQLGPRQLAAHQVAIMLSSLAFMVPLGIGGAAATRVGNAVGRDSLPDARRATAVCLGLATVTMIVSAAAFAFFPSPLARLFTDQLEVVALASLLLPIAALFQVVDGVQVVAFGVLRGTADTRLPAGIALVGFWGLGLPLAYYLAFHGGLGARGLWWGLTAGLGAAAVLLMFRIRARFRAVIETVD